VDVAYADDYRNNVNEGYDYYKNGQYDKAAEYYRQAGILKPDKALPRLGKGASLYKSNDFEGAAREFSEGINKEDKKTAADMYYNIGNAQFKAQKYQDAVKSYIDALKIDPNDPDFKHNLEMALVKQQQQQQQQQQDKNNKDKKNNQDKQDQNKQNQQNQQKQDDQQQQQQQNQDQQKNDQQQQQQQQAGNQQKMSKEEAQKLLARFDQDDKETQKKLKRFNVGRGSGNDW